MGPVEHELVRRSREWMEAVRRHDRAALEPLLGREFTFAGRRGQLSREEWLAAAEGPFELDDFALEESEVEVYGNTAVLSSRYRQSARLNGRDVSGDYLLTDVWVRRDGRWQAVRRHSSPVS